MEWPTSVAATVLASLCCGIPRILYRILRLTLCQHTATVCYSSAILGKFLLCNLSTLTRQFLKTLQLAVAIFVCAFNWRSLFEPHSNAHLNLIRPRSARPFNQTLVTSVSTKLRVIIH